MSAHAPSAPARTIPWRWILVAAAVVVIAAMALSASWRSDKAPRVTAGPKPLDVASYGAKTYPKVVAAIDKKAADIGTVAAAIKQDPDAAGKQYGTRTSAGGPFNFAVKGEGVAGKAEASLLPVKVKGLKDVTVNVAVGPAINGTSLRDAVGFINFNQFINQNDYADAGTAINDQVKAQVLKGVDGTSLKGKKVSFTGAFTYLAPTVMTITPTRFEVSG
jgi:predicted lipoprotein